MSAIRFQSRQCVADPCRFRFPVEVGVVLDGPCPRCGNPTAWQGEPYDSREVKAKTVREETPWPFGLFNRGPGHIEVLLDNIRSIYNVGSIFRTADGAGIGPLHLCGMTATPDHPKVAKTALGAEQAVPWRYHTNGVDTAVSLKNEGIRLWALEGGCHSIPITEMAPHLPGPPILLIVGNEVAGVDPAILDLCDRIVHLPMSGVKGSLNVATAFGVAAYFLRFAGFVAGKGSS